MLPGDTPDPSGYSVGYVKSVHFQSEACHLQSGEAAHRNDRAVPEKCSGSSLRVHIHLLKLPLGGLVERADAE